MPLIVIFPLCLGTKKGRKGGKKGEKGQPTGRQNGHHDDFVGEPKKEEKGGRREFSKHRQQTIHEYFGLKKGEKGKKGGGGGRGGRGTA